MSDTDPYPEALVRSCLEGMPGAFEQLIARYRPLVVHAVSAVLKRVDAGQDVELREACCDRTFAALVENDMRALRSFRGDARLGTFIAVIARRTTLRALQERQSGTRGDVPGAAEVAALVPDPAPGPAACAQRNEERKLVREAVAALPDRDALAIRLFYEHGLTHRAIGIALGVPTTHVGQILSRARGKLRSRLKSRGVGLERRG